MATVIVLGEGCRALNGSNASKWHKSKFQTFLSLQALQGCLRHRYKSSLANRRAAQYVHWVIDAPGLPSELIVFMQDVEILIALPFPRVTFYCIISRKCCYMCVDTRLHSLISYVLLALCIAEPWNSAHHHVCPSSRQFSILCQVFVWS